MTTVCMICRRNVGDNEVLSELRGGWVLVVTVGKCLRLSES